MSTSWPSEDKDFLIKELRNQVQEQKEHIRNSATLLSELQNQLKEYITKDEQHSENEILLKQQNVTLQELVRMLMSKEKEKENSEEVESRGRAVSVPELHNLLQNRENQLERLSNSLHDAFNETQKLRNELSDVNIKLREIQNDNDLLIRKIKVKDSQMDVELSDKQTLLDQISSLEDENVKIRRTVVGKDELIEQLRKQMASQDNNYSKVYVSAFKSTSKATYMKDTLLMNDYIHDEVKTEVDAPSHVEDAEFALKNTLNLLADLGAEWEEADEDEPNK